MQPVRDQVEDWVSILQLWWNLWLVHAKRSNCRSPYTLTPGKGVSFGLSVILRPGNPASSQACYLEFLKHSTCAFPQGGRSLSFPTQRMCLLTNSHALEHGGQSHFVSETDPMVGRALRLFQNFHWLLLSIIQEVEQKCVAAGDEELGIAT